jgi:acyl-CoA reductase-like NAD-dependent aldehyde dehydrogenase
LATRAIAFPLAAGNTVILKASEISPLTIWGIVSCFYEAGLPAGALNMVVHEPANAASITRQIIEDPRVKKINFTGSTPVGRIIGRMAGENLKPVLLELGGKAPAIVWKDADLELAAQQCALGAFLHAGQICMSTERILVHKDIRGEFETKLAAAVEKMFPSDGKAPVLVSAVGVEKNRKLVQDALSKGATLLSGTPDIDGPVTTSMRPMVIKDVKEDMDLYHTESFGPTVSLIEIETEEEALRIANDTEYGLTSAVFTENLRLGLRLAREIETGAVHINGMTVHDESCMPHGGAKSSGFGRFGTAHGLEEWVRTKNVTFKF